MQLVLYVKCCENIIGVTNRQVTAVCIVGGTARFGCRDHIRELLDIVFRKTIGAGFGGSCLKVVQVAVLFLIIRKSFSHMIQYFLGEILARPARHIRAYPFRVQTRLIHSDKTDCGEVVVKRTEITLCIRIKAFIQKFGNDGTLCFERTCCNIHHVIKAMEKVAFILHKVCQPRHIDCDDADRTGAFAGTEESAGFLAQLAQIQTLATAHGTDIARFHITVDIV